MKFVLFLLFFLCDYSFSEGYVFKADDFGRGGLYQWEKFFDLIDEYDAKVYLGVIVDDVDRNKHMKDIIANVSRNDNVRFFYHGNTHECGVEGGRKFGEFVGGGVASQMIVLTKAKKWMADNLNVSRYVFSAPCFATDTATPMALQKSGFDVWIFPRKDNRETFQGCKLLRTIDLERRTFLPDYKYFSNQVEVRVVKNPVVDVLQVHPGVWRPADFEEFELTLKYLKRNNKSYGWGC